MMIEREKKDLINFLMVKIFCHGQNTRYMTPIHNEYLTMVELLVGSVSDRNLLISTLERIYSGRNFFSPPPFDNLERVVRKIYDSYLPKTELNSAE